MNVVWPQFRGDMETEIQMAYGGEAVSQHSMDVDQLAPALLALGNLCKRANVLANGDRTTVRILVKSDLEHKCFLIHFQVVQDFYDKVQSLLGNSDVKTAKELLEWLGLLGLPTGGIGLIAYFKFKRGRAARTITKDDKAGNVILEFDGDDNQIIVNQNVYKLSLDRGILDSLKKILAPLKIHGIDTVEFRDKEKVTEKINKSEGAEIIDKERIEDSVDADLEPQVIEARLIIDSPHLLVQNKNWKFLYGDTHISVDIADSGMAEDVQRRGSVRIGDGYLVKMEIKEYKTETGQRRNAYKVKEIIKFLPAFIGEQMPLIGLRDGNRDR